MPQPIRVLVVDDSATARRLIVSILESDPAFRVVGEASGGEEAVELASRLAPDLITMDVHMPGMDGLEATKEIMIRAPTPILVVSADGNRNAMELSFNAMQAGALMVMAKPHGPDSPAFAEQRDQLVDMAKAMAEVKVVRRWGPRDRVPVASSLDGREERPSGRVVAIGTSTGGPAALRRLFIDLPRDFAAPIVVVQHISRGFVDALASWLNASCSLHVKVAEDGEPLHPRTAYLAPDDHHLGVRSDRRAMLCDAPPIDRFRPSATFLFESAARACGSDLVAVIMTGMGSDGVAGLRRVREAGGYVIAQDEASSVVFGMAREAVRANLANAVLPLERIGARLAELVAAG